jgi:nucleoside-diphosphate-sugar epimerase
VIEAVSVYSGVPVLVTGASGFIGRWIARSLTDAGADLTLAVRDAATMERVAHRYGILGEIRVVDFTDGDAIARLFAEVQPAITFNAAGYGVAPDERSPTALEALNALAVTRIAEAVHRHADNSWRRTQLVHFGSAAEYGSASGDLVETTDAQPATAYGRAKLAGTEALTRYCQSTGLRGVTLRLFTVYGPGEHAGRLLPSILVGLETRSPVPLSSGTQRRDFTYVEDVVDAALRFGGVDVPPGWIVNVATGRLTTVREFAETAARVLSMPPDQLRFGLVPVASTEMQHEPVNTARILSVLRWRPSRTIEQGVRATAVFLSSSSVEISS